MRWCIQRFGNLFRRRRGRRTAKDTKATLRKRENRWKPLWSRRKRFERRAAADWRLHPPPMPHKSSLTCVSRSSVCAHVHVQSSCAPRELFQEHISRVASGINRRCRGVARFFLLHTFRALSSFFPLASSPFASFHPRFFLPSSLSLSLFLSLVVEWMVDERSATKESRRSPQKVLFIHCSDSGPLSAPRSVSF